MTVKTNMLPGRCGRPGCTAEVPPLEGVFSGPPFRLWHKGCAPSGEVVQLHWIGGKVIAKPPGGTFSSQWYWEPYLEVLKRVGSEWNKEAGGQALKGGVECVLDARRLFEGQRFTVEIMQDLADRMKEIQAEVDLARQALSHRSTQLAAGSPERRLTLRPYQEEGVHWLLSRWPAPAILCDEQGLGKGGVVGSKVLTPDGWRTIESLRVGDRVIGSDGKAIGVLGVYPRGRLPVFRVTFSDRTSSVVDGEHLWRVRDNNANHRGGPWRVLQTQDLAGKLKASWRIPMVGPVELAARDYGIDPYVLGVLLGDGCFRVGHGRRVSFVPGDDLVPSEVARRICGKLVERKSGKHRRASCWWISDEGRTFSALLRFGLIGKLSCEKWIPDEALWDAADRRLQLLRGLMDTDGEARPRDGVLQFSSSSARLADGVVFLVQSLGGTARRALKKEPKYRYRGETRIGLPAHILTISMPPETNPLLAFAHRYMPKTKYLPARIMKKIEPAGEAEVVCIATDAPDQCYVTEDFVVTHNTPQLLMAIPSDQSPVVVVVPATIKAQWAAQARRWRPAMKCTVISGRGSFRWPNPGEILILNWELIPPYDQELPPAPAGLLVIADESHRGKNSESLRTRGLRELYYAAKAAGGTMWQASATPVWKDLGDLLTQLVNADLHFEAFGGDFELYRRLGGGYVDDSGFRPVTEWDPANVDPEFVERLRRVILRREKLGEHGVAKDLPPKLYEDIVVPVDLETMKACDAAVAALKEHGVSLEELHKLVHSKKAELGEVARAREALASCKLHAAIPLIEENERLGAPIVIMCAHRRPVEILAKRHGWTAIMGGISKKQRDTRSLGFQEGKYKGVACTIQAAGEGLDLFRAATLGFLDQAWTPGQNHQAEDRIHRIGQVADKVRIVRWIADHPLDRRLQEVLWDRSRILQKTVLATAVKEGDVWSRVRRMSEALASVRVVPRG